MQLLGNLLSREGNGVEQDYAKALELFRKAHAAGNALATYNLGVMYKNQLLAFPQETADDAAHSLSALSAACL